MQTITSNLRKTEEKYNYIFASIFPLKKKTKIKLANKYVINRISLELKTRQKTCGKIQLNVKIFNKNLL